MRVSDSGAVAPVEPAGTGVPKIHKGRWWFERRDDWGPGGVPPAESVAVQSLASPSCQRNPEGARKSTEAQLDRNEPSPGDRP